MTYRTYNVFCASPGDLEEERRVFYEVIENANEEQSMARGILLAPLSILPGVSDKRIFQAVVGENIRSCRYYLQLLEDTWGPPQRNFERDYAVAQRCLADPEYPMQEVVVLFKKPLLPHAVEPQVAELKRSLPASEFETLGEYRQQLRGVVARWLADIPDAPQES